MSPKTIASLVTMLCLVAAASGIAHAVPAQTQLPSAHDTAALEAALTERLQNESGAVVSVEVRLVAPRTLLADLTPPVARSR